MVTEWRLILYVLYPIKILLKFDLNGARKEAKNCIDILAQAPQFVARAKKIDDEENQFRFVIYFADKIQSKLQLRDRSIFIFRQNVS